MSIYWNIDSIPELSALNKEDRLKAHAACTALYECDRNRHIARTKRTEKVLGIAWIVCIALSFIIAKLWFAPNAEFIGVVCALVGSGLIGLIIHQLNIRWRRSYYVQYLMSNQY